MKQVLLDTSYLFYIMVNPSKLSDSVRRTLSGTAATFYVSAVSSWEMRVKYDARHPSGNRKSHFSPMDVLEVIEDQDVKFLHLGMNHAACPLKIPLNHKDPFDELLLVQAQEEGLRLLTVDKMLTGHPLAISAGELKA